MPEKQAFLPKTRHPATVFSSYRQNAATNKDIGPFRQKAKGRQTGRMFFLPRCPYRRFKNPKRIAYLCLSTQELINFKTQNHTRNMIRIFLTGYMGAGKTTLGKAFARELKVSFIDLDWYIEERFHKSIPQLFAERGEDGFRELERSMLHEAGEFEDVIISTGGGTPCFFDNMEYMNRQGQTVFLDVDTDVLFRRLRVATQQRPILQGKTDDELRAFIGEALERRMPHYAQARYRFDGSRLESRSQITESVARLRTLLGI